MKECGAYLQYKKNQGKGKTKDGAMPKGLEERRARCVAWAVRSSPVGTPCNSENEGNGNDVGYVEMRSASALISLAAAEAGVEEDQGEFEDLERSGVADEYGAMIKDHELAGL